MSFYWTWGRLFLDLCIICSDLCTFGTFANVLLMLQQKKSAAGISLQTLIAVVSARTLHLLSHTIGAHYYPRVLPFFGYLAMDVINAGTGILLLFMFLTQFYKTYDKDKDNFGLAIIKSKLPKDGPLKDGPLAYSLILYAFVFVGAFVWYFIRNSRQAFLTNYFFCFYEVMSMVALLPQLAMFHQDKKVSALLSNFVVLTAANRMCTLTFWVTFPMINVMTPDNRNIQMATEAFNILILSDFLYYYVRAKMRGESEVIIGDYDCV